MEHTSTTISSALHGGIAKMCDGPASPALTGKLIAQESTQEIPQLPDLPVTFGSSQVDNFGASEYLEYLYCPVARETEESATIQSGKVHGKERDIAPGRLVRSQRIGENPTDLLRRIIDGRIFAQDVEHAFLRDIFESEDEEEIEGSDSSDDDSNEDENDDESYDYSDDEMSNEGSCNELGYIGKDEDGEGDYNPTYMTTYVFFASQHEDS